MQKEKIPFSIERMKDAIRYETRDGREVSQVTVFDCKSEPSIVGVHNGKPWGGVLDQWSKSGNHLHDGAGDSHLDLFIITEKQIKYPFLCWVSDVIEDPSMADVGPDVGQNVVHAELMADKNKSLDGCGWKYSTPLTDEDLEEFGLTRVNDEKNT